MKTRSWIVLILLLLALSLGAALCLGKAPANRAEIYSGGALVATVDLRQDQVFTVPSPDSGSNTVTVRQGKIAVTQASCPDQWCVHQGFRNRGGDIICLPNRLVITFPASSSEIDGILG